MKNLEMENLIHNQINSINIDNKDIDNYIAQTQNIEFDEIYDENEVNREIKNIQEILYEDEFVQITKEYLKINKYYYPFLKEKKICMNKIKNVSLFKLTRMSGKYKFFGLNWDLTWFHLDKKRPQKELAIKINDDSVIKPVITPQNSERVYLILNDIIHKMN